MMATRKKAAPKKALDLGAYEVAEDGGEHVVRLGAAELGRHADRDAAEQQAAALAERAARA
jgi:hypothetical protein